jgi:dTDP-4-amino-4,6-dideoxygalactose transaminase
VNQIAEIRDIFKYQHHDSAETLTEMILTLPVHPLLKTEDIERIEKLLVDILLPTASGVAKDQSV